MRDYNELIKKMTVLTKEDLSHLDGEKVLVETTNQCWKKWPTKYHKVDVDKKLGKIYLIDNPSALFNADSIAEGIIVVYGTEEQKMKCNQVSLLEGLGGYKQ